MKRVSSVRLFIAFALFASFIAIIGDYNKPKASAQTLPSSVSYQLIGTEPLLVPLSSSNTKEKRIIKGMVVTEASSYDALSQIADHIKKQYALKNIDSIELTVHNPNSGLYEEEEAMPYEPISKGTISIAYTSLGQKELHMPKKQDFIIQFNN
ncbi:hypothetical protein [Ectobacillus panaciterrae]|uniref:hypothetical protein n=1 Tax=Ectobacillus panaciterrae TaxID=363872 RepID=UPI000425658E|nr:hypothetical protein [Ectobacillus panaciterrae]